ncbi:unnamed protein product [Parnassius apollo]|uniref:(apollo) hypothetical protein n=1 Tax=Parnassius apollo TaxID=110799 RepID=A0A8S3WFU6_PARAO|nr:unnamed protein product [Parnassius apollo]
MRRHLFDMLSRGVLELFPSTNTARRAGRPPANLFLNILAKKEKYNTQIFESLTFTSSTQIFESPTFTGSTQIIESSTFTDESQKDKNPTIDCLALTYSTQEKPNPTLRHANNEHTGSGQAKRRRKNTDYTQTKQIRNTESHRATRQIPDIRQAEQQRDTQDHRITRENPVFRDIEQRRDTQAHQIAREDPHYSQIERASDTRTRQSACCNSINETNKAFYFD